ncbi:NAD-dependent epimerase/dehydratase family protein [Amycolatopsis rhizosphaerae]|uniref:NAD-dependent epimerase/dehydratase family protein n=1 Tax=Amycolatopsis rhizosphaerae TaxID=2053003 RepID=A0A558CP82_9PSEU|nr:NAD(P)H-binding protein [Amycolatopsis rhizosphaerae]TVT50586.1 NAD-dependent epimerase/dehydratase family protein [Amycolatopsis rhizosphaerae]
MKITVFGASGGTGVEAVRQGLEAGHEVTAVVRDRARLAVGDQPRLEVVTADVFDPDSLVSAITGRDAVISALGARDRGPSTICRDGTSAIMRAMKTAEVRRLVVVSNSGMHTEGDSFFTGRIFKPVLIRILREAYADMRVMEERVTASGLDWTIVRPPRLRDWPRRGAVATAVGRNVRGSYNIGRADLAGYLLAAAADEGLVRTAVSVAQG